MNNSEVHRIGNRHWQTTGGTLSRNVNNSIAYEAGGPTRWAKRALSDELALHEPWVIPIEPFELDKLID